MFQMALNRFMIILLQLQDLKWDIYSIKLGFPHQKKKKKNHGTALAIQPLAISSSGHFNLGPFRPLALMDSPY